MQPYSIDIVIPWVNSDDPTWRANFNYWKRKETGNKDACRFRDWGTIRFVLRSIDSHCPWCRNVYLVLSNKSQIPSWLNLDNPSLKLVFHDEFIPKQFLPTFNSDVIEMFFPFIKGLSENFISCNDDMFFCQTMPANFYFNDGIPVSYKRIDTINTPRYNFENILLNNVQFINELTGSVGNYFYHPLHLPVPYVKSLQLFIHSKRNHDIYKALHGKFRTNDDISHWLYYDIQCRLGLVKFITDNRGTSYGNTGELTPINFNQPMICLNEGENSTYMTMKYYIVQLFKHFPEKSRFER